MTWWPSSMIYFFVNVTGISDSIHMWTNFGGHMSKRSRVMLDKTDRLTDKRTNEHTCQKNWQVTTYKARQHNCLSSPRTSYGIPFMSEMQKRTWWRHHMETFSALLVLCAGNSPVTGEFPAQRPVTRSFDAYVDLRPNKRLSKQSWGWWFESPSHLLWRHCNGMRALGVHSTHADSPLGN